MRFRPSEIVAALRLLTDDDKIIRFYGNGVLVLIENVYEHYLHYKDDSKELELLRGQVRRAIERLDNLKEKIEQETGLKFKKVRNFYSRFRHSYVSVVSCEIYPSNPWRENKRTFKFGLTMTRGISDFEFLFLMEGDPFNIRKTYENEKDILNLFKALEGLQIPKELYRISPKVTIVYYENLSKFYYKVQVNGKELEIPARVSFENGEFKEELTEEEWRQTLNNILKTELVEAL